MIIEISGCDPSRGDERRIRYGGNELGHWGLRSLQG